VNAPGAFLLTRTGHKAKLQLRVVLGSKDADQGGSVFWSWQIASNTNPGFGAVNVTCAGQTQMATFVITG